MSRISSETLSAAVDKLLAFSRGETKDKVEGSQRRFVETIELQISLRNYDANKDKRFAGAFRLPVPPRPKMTVCMMGTEEHCSQARTIGIDALVRPLLRARNLRRHCRRFRALKASRAASVLVLAPRSPRMTSRR